MSNESILQKVITSTNLGTGVAGDGFLSKKQAESFISYAWDATVLAKESETRIMNAPEEEWTVVAVGARIARAAVEAVDTGKNAHPSFSKVSIRTSKVRLDWELSTESLEDNVEGQNLDQHLARLFAGQFGQDMEDLAINGDTTSSDPLLKTFDGWHKQAMAGARVFQHVGGASVGLNRADFHRALSNVAPKYGRRNDLRFYASTQLLQDYMFNQSEMGNVPNEIVLQALSSKTGPSGPAGDSPVRPFGVAIREVPMFATDFNEYNSQTGTNLGEDTTSYLELTKPSNRIWGVQRDIRLYREYSVKKDTIEYTMFFRVGIAWQNLDAVVVIDNIPVIQA
ncbi:major capsid protein [Rhodococcus phage NiceHouse]|nr:major capsid protein [Rhodococcus phage NiceHouse]